jgi:sugar O-acyltransferase (sialic acid O-acetyltransferase NeuD family)
MEADMQIGAQPPVIVLGGGGHAKVLIYMLLAAGRQILGYTDPDETKSPILDVKRLGDDDAVFKYLPDDVHLVNGVGSVGSTALRKRIYDRFSAKGYSFAGVIHPTATVASGVQLSDGVQIMAGAILQPGSKIDSNAIVNSGAIIDHDCFMGAHTHIAPGAVLSGCVHVDTGAHIGTGACVIQGVTIGAGSVVGAGAVVINDVPPGFTMVGVPAKALAKTNGSSE